MSLREQAYHLIRKQITSLELPPGATIDEGMLQAELGLGRTPIREALLQLAHEGLVAIIPRRGMFVTEIGLTDLRKLFEVRVVIELLAVELAAQRGTAEHWRQMEELLSHLPEPGTPGENDIMIEIDEQCHRLIYEASGNPFLVNALTPLYAQSLRLWYLLLSEISTLHAAMQEHVLMLQAFKAGDVEQAVELMRRHIDGFQEEVQQAMLGQSRPKSQ